MGDETTIIEFTIGDEITDGTMTGTVRQVLRVGEHLYGYLVRDGDHLTVIRAADARRLDPAESWRETVQDTLARYAGHILAGNDRPAVVALDRILPASPTYAAAEMITEVLAEAFQTRPRADSTKVSRDEVLTTLRAVANTSAGVAHQTLDTILPISESYRTARELLLALRGGKPSGSDYVQRADVLTVLNDALDAMSGNEWVRAGYLLDNILPITGNYGAANVLVERIRALGDPPTAAAEASIEMGDFVRWADGCGLLKSRADGRKLVQVVTASGRVTVVRFEQLTLIAKA